MTTITELSEKLQRLLTTTAEKLGRETGFIRRERQVTAAGLAQALVLGGLAQPMATSKQTHHFATQAGLRLSVQGLDQRLSERAVRFMQALLMEGLTEMVSSNAQTVIQPQFNGVYVTDWTRLVWGKTGEKWAVQWELQRGQLRVNVLALTEHDQRAALLETELAPGSLHLADLGFFNLKRFQTGDEQGVYWLTRFKVGTRLFDRAGDPLDLKALLAANRHLNLSVKVGCGPRQVSATLLAAPLPDDALAKRHARLKEEARLDQRPLSPARLDLMGWTIYLTNIPDLTFEPAHILARTRWQIELLFKLWKSHAQVLSSRSANPLRQRGQGYAKLLAVLIAHWTLLVSGWQGDRQSPLDALRLVRTYIPLLIRACTYPSVFADFFFLRLDIDLLPRASKRRKTPRAFQLWYAFEDSFP